jgi:hypothetical protein
MEQFDRYVSERSAVPPQGQATTPNGRARREGDVGGASTAAAQVIYEDFVERDRGVARQA